MGIESLVDRQEFVVKALVTGGGGFLGQRIVELLLSEGHEVRIFARQRYPTVEALGAEAARGDLVDLPSVRRAVRGTDVVFHVASRVGYWGSRKDYFDTNVTGTMHVIQAMKEAGIPKLVYTSTPSVIGYEGDVEGVGNDPPFPRCHECVYPETKAEAERIVRRANGNGLASVALRPHLVIGPRDHSLLPRVIGRAASGRLPIIGGGTNLVDLTFIDNAAWAHIDAAKALESDKAPCAGNAYFVSNGEPVVFWEWINSVLVALGLPPVKKRISLEAARRLGATMEWAWRWLPLPGEPKLTRFLASAFARSHWYDMTPTYRDVGYHVRSPMETATRETVKWLKASGFMCDGRWVDRRNGA